MKRVMPHALAVLILVPAFTAQAAEPPLPGCYVPKRGFAASICTDTEACSTQSGVYRIVLRNNQAPIGERRLVISGTFQGAITGKTNECYGGAEGMTLSHLLVDKSLEGTLATSSDVACPVGGDGVTTLEVQETMNLESGSGIYGGLLQGGEVVLNGTLDLTTGINTFSVVPGVGEVCFDEAPEF